MSTMIPGSEGFHAALDADVTDMVTRLVYADWLDENGHPEMARGYRELAAAGIYPSYLPEGIGNGIPNSHPWGYSRPDGANPGNEHAIIPDSLGGEDGDFYYWLERAQVGNMHFISDGRYEIEDRCAKAIGMRLASLVTA